MIRITCTDLVLKRKVDGTSASKAASASQGELIQDNRTKLSPVLATADVCFLNNTLRINFVPAASTRNEEIGPILPT